MEPGRDTAEPAWIRTASWHSCAPRNPLRRRDVQRAEFPPAIFADESGGNRIPHDELMRDTQVANAEAANQADRGGAQRNEPADRDADPRTRIPDLDIVRHF